MTILSWHEHLIKEEIPPEHLWDDSQGLDMWWEYIRDKREDNIPIPRSGDDEDERDGRVAENDIAKAFKGGR